MSHARDFHPLVSVVLCTYNRGHLIGRAIRSVLAQTYPQWELIIVDDGSTDGSSAGLRMLARSDSRLRYIRHANRGLAHSRNVGLRLATGHYVTFLDSDDAYTPDHLARRVQYLRRNPGLDAVHGGLRPVGPRSRTFVPDMDRPGGKIHVSRCHAAGTLVARRSVLRRIGGFRAIDFSEDYDLIRRLAARFNVRRVSMRTYLYHVDADDRLCDLFAREGAEGILRYRKKQAGGTGAISRRTGRRGARSQQRSR